MWSLEAGGVYVQVFRASVIVLHIIYTVQYKFFQECHTFSTTIPLKTGDYSNGFKIRN